MEELNQGPPAGSMTNATLHIGLHKTGSTYLQHAFSECRDALAEHGWEYPELGLWGHGHHKLADAYRADDTRVFQEISEAFREVLASTEANVLISSERFEGLRASPDRLEQLARDLGNRSVRIVVFLRRRSDTLFSRWQQRIRYGYAESFPEFALRETLRGNRSHLLNFSAVVEAYARAFGDRAIRLVGYSTLVERKENLLDVFGREILGMPSDSLKGASGKVNSSLSPLHAEIIRLAHAEIDLGTRRKRAQFTDRFAEWLTGAGADVVGRLTAETADTERTINLAPIDYQFAESDRDLLDRFGEFGSGIDAPDRLFPPRKRSLQTYVQLSAHPGSQRAIGELLEGARATAATGEP